MLRKYFYNKTKNIFTTQVNPMLVSSIMNQAASQADTALYCRWAEQLYWDTQHQSHAPARSFSYHPPPASASSSQPSYNMTQSSQSSFSGAAKRSRQSEPRNEAGGDSRHVRLVKYYFNM